MMLLNTVSTMTSECFLVRSDTRETSSTSSAFVMLPPVMMLLVGLRAQGSGLRRGLRLPVAEVIAQRGRAGAFAFLVRFPVSPELVALQRPDAQADLPLLRAQLDDLHLVVVANLQIDLLAAARDRVRVVELRHVNQTLDPFVELDEGAEVGHAGDLPLDDLSHGVA